MTIPPKFLNDLRDRLTLSDIIGRRMSIKRAGREFKGCCPFHKEKTPSFHVNDQKQFYHCFGCGAHGDVINFVMQNDNLSFIEAIEMLAADAGMKVPQSSPEDVKKAKEAKSLYSLLEDTTKFFEDELSKPGNSNIVTYLHERGMGTDLLSAFRVGFSPDDGQALRQALKAKGYEDKDMIKAGVIRTSTKGTDPYAFFRGRIMFPVSDRRGRVVAFGGRILPEHMRPPERGDFKPPKYINSSDTDLFHKGRMLYAESHAREAALNNHSVIVTEGYVDVIACHKAGFKGAVAPLGTAVTEEQILSLWKMIPSEPKAPIFCFDGDNAGRRAAERASNRLLPLLKAGHSAQFVFLPDGEDPDTLIKSKGAKAFRAVLETAMPLIDVLWASLTEGKSFKTPEERASLSKAADDMVKNIADGSVQKYYKQSFNDRIYNFFREMDRQNYQANKAGYNKKSSAPKIKIKRPAIDQNRLRFSILLAGLINHPLLLESIEDDLLSITVTQARLAALLNQVMAYIQAEVDLDTKRLQTHLKEEGFKAELDLIIDERVYTHAGFVRPDSEFEDVIAGCRDVLEMFKKQSLKDEIKNAGHELARDMSEDSESRWRAYYDMQKTSS